MYHLGYRADTDVKRINRTRPASLLTWSTDSMPAIFLTSSTLTRYQGAAVSTTTPPTWRLLSTTSRTLATEARKTGRRRGTQPNVKAKNDTQRTTRELKQYSIVNQSNLVGSLPSLVVNCSSRWCSPSTAVGRSQLSDEADETFHHRLRRRACRQRQLPIG